MCCQCLKNCIRGIFRIICFPFKLIYRKRFILLIITYISYLIHVGITIIKQEKLLKSLQSNLTHKVIHERYWSQDLENYAASILNINNEITHTRQQIRLLDIALPRERSLRVYGIDENIDAYFEDLQSNSSSTVRTNNFEKFFQSYLNNFLNLQISLAEIETVERVGIDTHLSSSQQNHDHHHSIEDSKNLAPRPIRIFLSNGYTTKKILTNYNNVAYKNINDYNFDNRIAIVPDKARGWVNLHNIAEHCSTNFTISPGNVIGSYKSYDFITKKNHNINAGAAFFNPSNGNFLTMAKFAAFRNIMKFQNIKIFRQFMEYSEEKNTEQVRKIMSENEVSKNLTHGTLFDEFLSPFAWSGTDHVFYENSVYFVRYNTTTIVRYDITDNKLKKARALEEAENDISGGECQFESDFKSSAISLKLDETGLWVLFCTKNSNGLMVLGKLDHINLEIRRKFQTNLRKVWLEQAFMSCGILYGLRRYNNDHVIKYVYNTHTQTSSNIYLPLVLKRDRNSQSEKKNSDKIMHRITSVSFVAKYSHKDKIDPKIVVWDESGTITAFRLYYGFYGLDDFLSYNQNL